MSKSHPRVLFTNHNGYGPEGGSGRVLVETVNSLRTLGVTVNVTNDLYPDVHGFDLVHAYQAWPPETALTHMRYLSETGIPIIWEPIFSDLCEFAWAMRAIRLLSELVPDSEAWRSVLAGIGSSTLIVDGMSRWGQNEIIPGYLDAIAEMFALSNHVSVCSLHEIGMLSRVAPTVHAAFTVVHHGVDAQKFANADASDFTDRYGLADFILCVGTIERRKNQILLVEAARQIDRPIVLIGPVYPGDDDYLQLCRLRGGESLTYIDRLPHELIAAAYKAAAVHVLPSFAEGSALSTMEAAAAGCDIVTSNSGSEFEYYGDLARTCDPLSPSSIKVAIEHALLYSRGDQLAARMRAFSWTNTAKATLGIYNSTLTQPAA